MGLKHLCLLFGVTPTVASCIIDKMEVIVCNKLKDHDQCKIKLPNELERQEYANIISKREPLIHNCIGFVDGVAIPIECSSDQDKQDVFYNGYHGDTMVNNVLAFAPTGNVIFVAINHPGSWHDSTVAARLTRWAKDNLGDYCFCVVAII